MNLETQGDNFDINFKKYSSHIKELLFRLKFCIWTFIFFSCIGFFFKKDLLQILLKPLTDLKNTSTFLVIYDTNLVYTNLIDGFLSYIKISILFGFILTLPIISWQIFQFITPGLYKQEKFIATIILIFSPILGFFGVFFAYFLVIPNAWKFFYSFSDQNLTLLPKINEYLSLVISIFLSFSLAFQFPIIIFLLLLSKIITVQNLIEYRKIMIFINFVISGVLTPPDILSQFMLAIPLIVMYEFVIIAGKLIKNNN